MLKTLDYTIRIGSTPIPFYISIGVSTLPMQHTAFIYRIFPQICKIVQ